MYVEVSENFVVSLQLNSKKCLQKKSFQKTIFHLNLGKLFIKR